MIYLNIIYKSLSDNDNLNKLNYPIKLYHNHHIIYLKDKNEYCVKLDFDIERLYLEISTKRIIFNVNGINQKQTSIINFNNTNFLIIVEKKYSTKNQSSRVDHLKIPIIENEYHYLYFPKFKSLLPEWKSDTNIFYKISDYFNLKSFRTGITHLKLLKLVFNSEIIGKKLISNFSIDKSKYHISKPYTFRNVFIRRLIPELEEKVLFDNNLYSVASARVHLFKPNKSKYNKSKSNKSKQTYPDILIKGSKFDHKKIIKSDSKFEPKFMIVFRLAPQDYHHFYMPTSGKLKNYYYMGDDYQSVGYEFMYSKRFNPLNDNFRLVLEFEHLNSNKRFFLVIIGATIVGSIIIGNKLKIGHIYMSKQHLGHFDLGGSCVVFLSEDDIFIRSDLISNSANNIETYFSVYDKINQSNKDNIFVPSIGSKYLILHHLNTKKRTDIINESKLFRIIKILIMMSILIYIMKCLKK